MGSTLSEVLRSGHDRFFDDFSDYLECVEEAFLNEKQVRASELHRGKHFLAHGIMGQFAAKQALLFPALSENGHTSLRQTLKQLHDRCTQSIRLVHETVNALTQQDASDPDRQRQAREILRHLYQIEALLETVFEIEERLVEDQVFRDLPPGDIEALAEKLDQAAQQNKGCPSQGKHHMH